MGASSTKIRHANKYTADAMLIYLNDKHYWCKPLPCEGMAQIEYPDCEVFRSRIKEVEWNEFAAELAHSLYTAHPSCYFIQTALGLVLCCPLMHVIKSRQAHLINATYKVLAKYNKYLFKPRNIQVRLQYILHLGGLENTAANEHYYFLKFNLASPNASLPAPPQEDQRVEEDDYYPTVLMGLECWHYLCCVPHLQHQLREDEISDDQLQSKFIMANRLYSEQSGAAGTASTLSLTMDRGVI